MNDNEKKKEMNNQKNCVPPKSPTEKNTSE